MIMVNVGKYAIHGSYGFSFPSFFYIFLPSIFMVKIVVKFDGFYHMPCTNIISVYPYYHRENGGTLGMVPLIINPIYSLYTGYLSGISPLKGVLGGLKELGYHPKGTTIFPMILVVGFFVLSWGFLGL